MLGRVVRIPTRWLENVDGVWLSLFCRPVPADGNDSVARVPPAIVFESWQTASVFQTVKRQDEKAVGRQDEKSELDTVVPQEMRDYVILPNGQRRYFYI